MAEPQWVLRLSLEGPFGERYQTAMHVDAFYARDQLVEINPPSEFDLSFGPMTMDAVVERIRKREIRHDILARECQRLGERLAQEMQDAEGWHDASRVPGAKERLSGKAGL
jgi:hypothetical protein